MNPDTTKLRILTATEQLLGEVGFDGMSTRDIAERSGVNKALIHYHFRTKEELLAVLLNGYYDRLTQNLVAAMALRPQPEEQVQDVVDAYADFLAQNRTFCSVVHREVASGRHVGDIVARTLPVLQLGTAWLGQVAVNTGDMAELVHVLTSVYGMVVTYFTHGRVLSQLSPVDPFSPDALEARKRHVRRVVALLFEDFRRHGQDTERLTA